MHSQSPLILLFCAQNSNIFFGAYIADELSYTNAYHGTAQSFVFRCFWNNSHGAALERELDRDVCGTRDDYSSVDSAPKEDIVYRHVQCPDDSHGRRKSRSGIGGQGRGEDVRGGLRRGSDDVIREHKAEREHGRDEYNEYEKAQAEGWRENESEGRGRVGCGLTMGDLERATTRCVPPVHIEVFKWKRYPLTLLFYLI